MKDAVHVYTFSLSLSLAITHKLDAFRISMVSEVLCFHAITRPSHETTIILIYHRDHRHCQLNFPMKISKLMLKTTTETAQLKLGRLLNISEKLNHDCEQLIYMKE